MPDLNRPAQPRTAGWALSVAPMLHYTDRHARYFLRLLTRETRLYTEMVTTGAILRGNREFVLGYHDSEHPLALQLGGSDPGDLAECARVAARLGYDEINLNVGCPSDRVKVGRFGACLMAEPERVAAGVAAMSDAVSIPVTVKTRIGIDDRDSYAELVAFVDRVAAAGCRVFIIHARKAWLTGLSPRENREIPPLRYDVVYRLKRDLPHLQIVINGGISMLAQVSEHLRFVDGVMIGRAAFHDPYLLAGVDEQIYEKSERAPSRRDVIERFLPYIERQLAAGVPLAAMTRPILGVFQGQPGARTWRRYLSENAHRPGAGVSVVERALTRLSTVSSKTTGAAPLPMQSRQQAALA